jgi:hypothetical protein
MVGLATALEMLFMAIILFGIIAAILMRKHYHEAKLVRLREIVHIERMKAMEQGIELPHSDADQLQQLMGSGHTDREPDGISRSRMLWIRFSSMGLGLVCIFGGIGASLGLVLQHDLDVAGTWAVGFIPLLLGIGLLFFYRLSKGLADGMVDNNADGTDTL